jgi:hypothetical protein
MGDGVDGRLSALQEFASGVARTSGTIPGPATQDAARPYAPPAMPVDTLQALADRFKKAMLDGADRTKSWDDEFRSSLNLYSDFANTLGTRIDEVDNTHGQALKDLLKQMSDQIPHR